MAKPFVVLFTARSGSTALYGNLKSHPDILMRAEVFGNKVLPGDLEQNHDNRIAFLRRFWSGFKNKGTPSDGVSRGFKFQVSRTREQFSAPMRFAKVAKEYQPAVIVLRRENRIKQAISAINGRRLMRFTSEIANTRGTAHIKNDQIKVLDDFKRTPFDVDMVELDRMGSVAQSL